MGCLTFCRDITRKKDLTVDMQRGELSKVLNLSDLTFLAIGSMIGSGLYVLTGSIARNVAGPSIVISYAIAAVASGFSAICYAELAARIPVTGSAYQFTYLCIGEIWAFTVGWAVYIEHVVTAAAVARAWSGYIDGLFGHPVKAYLEDHVPLPGGLLATYPDFIAAALVIILSVIVAFGVKISSKFNVVFATLNLIVILFIIITGFYLAKFEYWTDSENFMPYGWSGTISGASTLIFSYVGYEVIASATEEAVKPKRDVPLSLLIALIFVVVAYIGASASLTLMVPWQNISVEAPFPTAYKDRGWNWAQYLVSIGALAAMTAALLTTLILVPRYLYAMARDGLLMVQCGKINKVTKVPVLATIFCGIFCAIITLLFDLNTLVEFIAIGQLTACTFVSICVIKLRYQPGCVAKYESLNDESNQNDDTTESTEERVILSSNVTPATQHCSNQETNLTENSSNNNYHATQQSDLENSTTSEILSTDSDIGIVKAYLLKSNFKVFFKWTTYYRPGDIPLYSLLVATLSGSAVCVMFLFGYNHIQKWWFIILLVIFFLTSITCLLYMSAFNQDTTIKTFKVPLVPLVPYISIIINILLILKLKQLTWIRFAAWLVLGFIVYGVYGYRHSEARKLE